LNLVLCAVPASAEATPTVVEALGKIALRDPRGAERVLSPAERSAVVVVFLGTECPLVKLYTLRLNELAARFATRNVELVGVDSNQQDSLEEIHEFVRRQNATFPILKDPDHKLADLLYARRTPEAFVIDSRGEIRYRGRIDDQYGVGFLRPNPTRKDLEVAVEEVLAGKDVSVAETEAQGCIIGRAKRVVRSEDVTYTRDVAKIFNDRCVRCHRPGEIGPFPMTRYEEVVGWADTIREVIDQGRMPPWFADPHYGDFLDDPRLSDDEKATIARWVDNGCPKGDDADLPPPPSYVDGWQMETPPDLVFAMADKPFQVPAEGSVDYVYYEIDPKWDEDKWIYGSEARPGNRAVVHHILVFCKRPGKWYPPGLPGELISAYAPGMKQTVGADKSMAALLPKGSKIVMQMHYTPNGVPQEDLSYFGLKFADPADIEWEIKPGMAINFLFRIPPRDPNYRVPAMFTFGEDSLLLGVNPHMHLRGKSFLYEALYPDGRRETLMSCPKFDFNWQIGYQYRKPIPMPKGTKMICTAYFDNSEGNLSNPDPNQTVRFGEQTWDEMMIGWFYYAVKRDESLAAK
jgi:peroxiredoxin/mono/diheme cytochrome c family protein